MPSQNYSSISQDEIEEIRSGGSSSSRHSSPGASAHKRRRRNSKVSIYLGEASWLSCVINLLNTIVGAGVLAMPHAMSQFGMALGIFVIVFSGFASGFGLYLQARCSKYVPRGSASFFTLSQLTYPNAAVVFDAAIAIKCFGVAVSYLIIIGELTPQVIAGFGAEYQNIQFLADRHFWITAFMLVMIPLSFLRRLDSLKYTSFVALVSIGYLVILVFAHFVKGDTLEERGDIKYVKWAGPVEALSSFPVIVFAYTCHQNMFGVVNEIKDASHKSTLSVVLGSIGSAAAIYLLVAITGYISFGDNVSGNIIAMYRASPASTIGRLAIVILVMFSYPLQVHPCRGSLNHVLNWRPKRSARSPMLSPHGGPRVAEMSDLKFAGITTFIIIGTYMVAMSVSSLERVLAYVGSTGSTSISFILPGLFYWKISNPEAHDNFQLLKEHDDEIDEELGPFEDSLKTRLLRKGALVLSCYGFVVMATCLALNIFFNVSH